MIGWGWGGGLGACPARAGGLRRATTNVLKNECFFFIILYALINEKIVNTYYCEENVKDETIIKCLHL